ncbi:MlaA family lipoprotein [Caulobacter sp. AP07]|uniref:MlaA family lipoprotein n=1 Tax=Caulobacter sp. AP07 TaxID=1144304 RepID=UPI00068C523A|nr:VacJ family lipoprotein [Caulobacter sp. AP07]
MTEARPAQAQHRAGLASTALGLIAAAGLMAIASPAFAQTAAEPAEASPQDAAPLVDAPPVQDPGLAAYDPLEGFNRASFGVSMGLDRAVVGPIAHGYMAVTPKPVRNRVSSVIYNLGEPSTALNDVLQGHPKRFGVTTSRFVINSTIGLLGLFDVAAGMGLQGHGADFGQTFGRYGVKPGPYLYVPVMGPLSFREGVGRALDFATDPVGIIGGGYTTTFGATRLGVGVVDVRARADGAFRALDDSVDPYVTARSAYGQYRESFLREATGEVQALPDFDDAPSTSSEAPSAVTTSSAAGPQ